MAPALSDILRLTSSLLVLLLLMFCMGAIILEAQDLSLAPDEVEALLEVATQLGKKGWNRNMTLCNDTILPLKLEADNKVVCNCSFPGEPCHVIGIYLKRQDLDGTLPKAIEKLPHLKHLGLWANYLSGNIPPEWANTKLETLSVGVNRLTGKIPSYLGRITTLGYLNIQDNMFSGTVPPELGGLVNLENLTLSGNYLTGELPPALTNLTGLKELRLSGNNFTGRIPDFIRSWKQLDTLEIQAGGFTGPIPSSISLLTNLTDLKISNLLGDGSEFPNLESIAGIKYLMLSNCNLSGNFPIYLTRMAKLKILDLSFNRLNGSLPTNYDGLKSLEKMKPVECLRACSEERYSVHINCGGPEATIGNTIYEADNEPGGAAKYASKREDWQTSTTGHIWDVPASLDFYIAKNKSTLRMDNSVLYTNARLTPLSLTYHVPCLVNGNYKIKLHFAEIVMRDNRSYYSLGRRIFDVYIQDIVVLKDFDIVKAAGGADKVYIHNYTAPVTNGALEIRLHWAGKGTTRSPTKGTYGPLISAIDVESDFKPPDKGRKRFIVAGAVVLPLFLILVFLSTLWWKGYLGGRKSRDRGKGVLSDGTPIAVKQLSAKSKQGNREGYMAPEYALYGYLTYKADVYSFGVVALEIVSGMNNVKFRRDENFVCLLDWVLYLQKNGDIMEIVDPRLGSEFNKKEVVRMINVALLCTNQSPALRPTMSTVVSMLEGKTDVEELVMVPSTLGDPSGYATALHKKFAQSSVNGSLSETQSLVKSSEGPWTASSSSSAN
uniref:non-specific serine/threonine protein kinase n=1 Tax=Populus alba TaxID=43335 RepID=A0A4U5PYC0_POPAL|nr:putative leucine-rich repeat receptor-like serine/threonine-protein kinase [Populus alba]